MTAVLFDPSTDFSTVVDDLVAVTVLAAPDLTTGAVTSAIAAMLATGATTPTTSGVYLPIGTLNSNVLYFNAAQNMYLFFDSVGGWCISTSDASIFNFGHPPYFQNPGPGPTGSFSSGSGVTGTPVITAQTVDTPFDLDGDAPAIDGVQHCAARSITAREAAESFGRYQLEDQIFTFPDSEASPELGGSIIDDEGETWVILDANHERIMALWKVTARNLAITGNLNETITVQQRQVTKGSEGAVEWTWATLYSNVRARIQEDSSERSEQFGRQSATINANCFLQNKLLLDNSHRLVRSDNTTYEVIGYENPDQIGALTTINCLRRLGATV